MTVLIPFASLEPSPWKNGGGSTTEIAVFPPEAAFDEFDWRISLATIEKDGPFSVFPGIDRTLALIEGAGTNLDFDGERRFFLSEDDPVVEFAGESSVVATVANGPTTDFNVMTRRSRCHHRLGRRTLDGICEFAPRGDVTILFLADGESLSVCSDSERIGMVRFDAVVFDTDTVWKLEAGRATVLVVDIFID
ncbi:HutD/Ves family protein [Massilia cavernae]|uniref:HutD family protein n=1 Tax=Massilia cavernae TaxID=2320864 RepID=A0A418XS00_9BURK|nr:HutD family protein [Massilia cavernae]RJG15305.1 HutD family protein [Massilia cavernae]